MKVKSWLKLYILAFTFLDRRFPLNLTSGMIADISRNCLVPFWKCFTEYFGLQCTAEFNALKIIFGRKELSGDLNVKEMNKIQLVALLLRLRSKL